MNLRYLKADSEAAHYFYDAQGAPRPVAYILKNPEFARVLRDIAAGGADAFYAGRIAKEIAQKVRSHATNPGTLSSTDIEAYQAKLREPLCSDYKKWTVCGMPPPSSGGIGVAQMLSMLETKEMERLAPIDGVLNVDAIHLFSEVGRLAYADRARYVADTDFVSLPPPGISALLDKKYLMERTGLIKERSMGIAKSGNPFPVELAIGKDTSPEFPCTSHIAIIDASGNAVSMTTTIEDVFGSRQMVNGFLLNNQLTDFSFDAWDANGPVANRVQPGKRPRSSMAPTFVFEKSSKKLLLITGSSGGSAIINYVAKVLVGTMDWGMSMQQAISLPNIGSRNGPTELEQGRISVDTLEKLKARGHALRLTEQTSGLQGIMRKRIDHEDVWIGGADPRREGIARGE